MPTIKSLSKWNENKKVWWELWASGPGDPEMVAKVKSKGLAWKVAQALEKIYQEVEVR